MNFKYNFEFCYRNFLVIQINFLYNFKFIGNFITDLVPFQFLNLVLIIKSLLNIFIHTIFQFFS